MAINSTKRAKTNIHIISLLNISESSTTIGLIIEVIPNTEPILKIFDPIKFPKEIIIVYDSEQDNAINVAQSLVKEFDNIKLVHNKIEKGVRHAVEAGVQNAKYEIILITAVDEIFPIVAVDKMISR